MANQDLLSANIIALLGLEPLPAAEKAALIDKMAEVVYKRVLLRVFNELDDAAKDELADLDDAPEDALRALAEKVPGFEGIMKEEIIKLKEEMVKATNEIG